MKNTHDIHTAGISDRPKVFAELICPSDQVLTRHSQLRVVARWSGHWKAEWQILVRCSVCRLEYIWHTNEVPMGMKLYHVRVNAHGRLIPELNQYVETLTEEFTVLAPNRQAAYRQSLFSHTMPLSGQSVETLIDGTEERDERF